MAMLAEAKHLGTGETIPRGSEEVFLGGVRFIVNGEEAKARLLQWHAEDMERKKAAKEPAAAASDPTVEEPAAEPVIEDPDVDDPVVDEQITDDPDEPAPEVKAPKKRGRKPKATT